MDDTIKEYNIGEIYKIIKLVSNKPSIVLLFCGITLKTQKSKNSLNQKLFTDDDLEDMRKANTLFIYSRQLIHIDDTINTIKLKILWELNKLKKTIQYEEEYDYERELLGSRDPYDILFEEMYLFSTTRQYLDISEFYNELTKGNNLLTKQTIEYLQPNIENYESIVQPLLDDHKESTYSEKELRHLFYDKEFTFVKPLGQPQHITNSSYPTITNPFLMNMYNKSIFKPVSKHISGENILFQGGLVANNNIYLIDAHDLLQYFRLEKSELGISEKTILNEYYPFLYKQKIYSFDDLLDSIKRDSMIQYNKEILNNNTKQLFDNVQMFHNIQNLKIKDLPYISQAVSFLSCTLKPIKEHLVSIESLFKIINSNELYPMIKYNPSNRQENVFRFFAPNVSTLGTKIPYLRKATIFKYMNYFGKNKSVSLFIQKAKSIFIYEFDELGYINIICDINNSENDIFDNEQSFTYINSIIKDTLNPIIQKIYNKLSNMGYNYSYFDTIFENDIVINKLTHESNLKLKKDINFDEIKNCMSSIFINEGFSPDDNTHKLRYKRVSNFNNYTSQEIFIIDKIYDGMNFDEIKILLLDNFKFEISNETVVDEMIKNVLNELEMENNSKKKMLKFKSNPGFSIKLKVNKIDGTLNILIENINDIRYLIPLGIYIDSLLILIQNKKLTKLSSNEINNMCSKKIENIVMVPKFNVENNENEDKEELLANETNESNEDIIDFNLDDLSSDNDNDVDELNFEMIPDSPISDNEDSNNDDNNKSNYKNAMNLFLDSDEDDSDEEDDNDNDNNNNNNNDKAPQTQYKGAMNLFMDSDSDDSENDSDDKEDDEKKELYSGGMKGNEEDLDSLQQYLNDLELNVDETNEKPSNEKEDKLEVYADKSDDDNTDSDKSDDSDEDEYDLFEENDMINIDNIKLNNPYYFQARMEKREPKLIVKKNTKEYNAYSRVCHSDTKRQPVILTDQELEKIKKENDGYLKPEDVIKYGTNKNKKFNYICPQYWCLKSNTIMNPNDMKLNENGELYNPKYPECGKVLPDDATEVKPGYYIYKFHDDDVKKYPGFSTNKGKNKHPDGYCLPCCFTNFKTTERAKIIKQCTQEGNEVLNTKEMIKEKRKKNIKATEELIKNINIDDDIDNLIGDINKMNIDSQNRLNKLSDRKDDSGYIIAHDKFPIERGRWGYIPLQLQLFFHNKTNSENVVLIRHGVEINKKHSFVSCIADAMSQDIKKKKSNIRQFTTEEMRIRFTEMITIDTFIQYQNGNLVESFYSNEIKIESPFKEEYTQSKLYNKLNIESNQEDYFYYFKVINAFEHFKIFLLNNDNIITHQYLWDLVTMPNPKLFTNGINLVIFEIKDEDITNNISIICPTNYYSSTKFHASKGTLMLIKVGDYYEPIYGYNDGNIPETIFYIKNLGPMYQEIKYVLMHIIKPLYETNCAPKPSMPLLEMTRPINFNTLIDRIKRKYNITSIVLNYNNKVIGVTANTDKQIKSIFIPCFPMGLNLNTPSKMKDYEYVFMNNPNIWKPYNDTVNFLTILSKTYKGENRIPCLPKINVIHEIDGNQMVVGIITETDQFIQISEPVNVNNIPEEYKLLDEIVDSSYVKKNEDNRWLSSDVITSVNTSTAIDSEVTNIQLETHFVDLFRKALKKYFINYENARIKNQIKELVNSNLTYLYKRDEIIKTLKSSTFMNDIEFTENVDILEEIKIFFLQQNKNCIIDTEGETTITILPRRHLITNVDNEILYFNQIVDELIRYSRIQKRILDDDEILNLRDIKYEITDNEVLLYQSLITQQYFEKLIVTNKDQYIKNSNYHDTQPLKTNQYNNKLNYDELVNKSIENAICIPNVIYNQINIPGWSKTFFPKRYHLVEYQNKENVICNYKLLIDITKQVKNINLTIQKIKSDLLSEYNQLFQDDQVRINIYKVLLEEGKKESIDMIKNGFREFDTILLQDNYILSPLDLWIILKRYDIPHCFLSSSFILESNYKERLFVGHGNMLDKFVIIVIPNMNTIMKTIKYSVVQNEENEFLIDKNKLENVDLIDNLIVNKIELGSFLSDLNIYSFDINKKKKNKQKIIIENN